MNQSEALGIVWSLANGVYPETGEVFPADSAYQRAQTVRALYADAEALEKAERFERRKRELPAKTGEPGTEDEDRRLLAPLSADTALQRRRPKNARDACGSFRAVGLARK